MTEQNSPSQKLYKSRKDKMIDGVCGGIAEYFQIDPTIVRIIGLASLFIGGLGFLSYVVAAMIIPPNPEHNNLKKTEKKDHHPQIFWGILLIILGFFFLFRSWHFPFFWHWPFHFWYWDWWKIPWSIIGPVLMIGLGVFYILHVLKSEKPDEIKPGSTSFVDEKKLKRPVKNRMIAGVCAAFANHFKIDPTWVRIGYALLALFTNIAPLVILYVVLIFVIPKESEL
ncbi:PspC domain-containing protein [bacterium]|nr:PspC domain-containing protein [bacterium]